MNSRGKTCLTILFPLLFLLLFPSCTKNNGGPIVRQTTAMNTYVAITIYDSGSNPAVANAWIDSSFAEIQRVEGLATDYSDSSEVGRINTHAGTETTQVSNELIALLRLGQRYGEASEWKLDITVKPLVKAWDFLSGSPHTPSGKTIEELLPLVDARLLSIVEDRVYLPKRGMGIDIGSFGKGYAIDRAVQMLRRAGYRQFIVDIGGKLGVYWEGTHMLDSTAAEVLIRHPRRQGEYLGAFRVGSGAVSTSGDYERYFVEDGTRYHHLLDPATGYPVRGVVSVTLVAADATFADALSTMVFLLGRKKGMELMKNSPGVDGIIVYEAGDSLAYDITPRFQSRFIRTAAHD